MPTVNSAQGATTHLESNTPNVVYIIKGATGDADYSSVHTYCQGGVSGAPGNGWYTMTFKFQGAGAQASYFWNYPSSPNDPTWEAFRTAVDTNFSTWRTTSYSALLSNLKAARVGFENPRHTAC